MTTEQKPRKCYIMVEDLVGTAAGEIEFQYAMDMGLGEGEELPESVDAMTPAQELIWRLYSVIRTMVDPDLKAQAEAEVASKLLVPEHIARETH